MGAWGHRDSPQRWGSWLRTAAAREGSCWTRRSRVVAREGIAGNAAGRAPARPQQQTCSSVVGERGEGGSWELGAGSWAGLRGPLGDTPASCVCTRRGAGSAAEMLRETARTEAAGSVQRAVLQWRTCSGRGRRAMSSGSGRGCRGDGLLNPFTWRDRRLQMARSSAGRRAGAEQQSQTQTHRQTAQGSALDDARLRARRFPDVRGGE